MRIMVDSLELYQETLTFAKNNPTGAQNFNSYAVKVLKNYYLQLVTTTFYELVAKKNSPLVSLFCQINYINFAPKNFNISHAGMTFNLYKSFDMYLIIYGLNVAFAENLDSCLNVFETCTQEIFRGLAINDEGFRELPMYLTALDESLGKFGAIEKIIEVPVEKVVEKIVEVPVQSQKISFEPDEQDKEFLKKLNELVDKRHADDENLINGINAIQLALQEELPRLQNTLKNIAEIRDGIDYKTLAEPINQLIQLYGKLNDTLQRHPQADAQKGYETLLKRCKNFSRFLEQSLAMLGAELINEINIPLDFGKHEVINAARPSDSATVSKILRVGVIYKGQVLRKAEVEIAEPLISPIRGTSASDYLLALRQRNFGR